MEFVKMEDYWLCVESEDKYQYGELFISFFNQFCDIYNNMFVNTYHKIKETLTQEYISNNEKILEFFELLIKTFGDYICADNDINFAASKILLDSILPYLLTDELFIFPTKHTIINDKWYPTYIIDGNYGAFLFLDLMEIHRHNYTFSKCLNCNTIYLKHDNRQKYCKYCSSNYKAINDSKRKNTPRGLHQKVANYLRNSEKFTAKEQANFMNESNYYWDKLNGKTELINTYLDINLEADYINWLTLKHNTFKEIAKTRRKCHF